MTSHRRFEQDLPDLLAQLAPGPVPDYRNDIVQQTARMRQRPAWMFPERWLPMTAVTSGAAGVSRVPWRAVGLVAILLIALVIGAVLVAGSQSRVPPPFGPAANGLVAYETAGDIYAADPITGKATAIVTGPATDVRPVWSRTGTQVAFERKIEGAAGLGQLYVADATGRGAIAVTPHAMAGLAEYTFSPDGRELLFISGPEGHAQLWIAKTDGSGASQLDVGKTGVVGPAYRGPDGAEIVFVGAAPIEEGQGVFAVDVASGEVRTVLAPVPGVGRDVLRVAPDGTRLAFSAATADPDRNTYRVHVATMDGQTDLTLPMSDGATFEDAPAWSNDSTRLAVTRGFADRNQEMVIATVPADASGPGTESARGLTGCCDTSMEWAPDDSSILVRPVFSTENPLPQLLMDPATGATSPAPWSGRGDSAWQRSMR